MLDRISKETGVTVSPQDHIRCLPCDLTRSGGYAPALGTVRLCYGHFWSKKQMEHTLTHELVHMYDHCKFDTDWSNLRHHACTEVCVIEIFRQFVRNPCISTIPRLICYFCVTACFLNFSQEVLNISRRQFGKTPCLIQAFISLQ